MIAGGRGRRLGGAKATAELEGRPLLSHALAVLRAVTDEIAVVAKPGTALPDDLHGAERWHDDQAGFHPRHGLVTALRRAAGAPVLALAVDLPRVTPDDLHRLLGAATTSSAVASDPTGRLQPLLAVYTPDALATLESAPPDEPLTRTVRRLRPVLVDVPSRSLVNVNTPDDLSDAARRGTPAPCDDP